MSYPFSEAGITAALAALGDTPDDVASVLGVDGFVGEQKDDCGCPVALYLQAAIEGRLRVGIYYDNDRWFALVWTRESPSVSHVEESADLPDPVRDFVLAFDRGEYPDLIEESSHV